MTSWTDYLAQQGASVGTDARPTLRFGAAADEARAAGEQTVAVPLLHLGLIRSVGPESAPFLHNLFSNDVNKLAAGQAQWNSFNTPKGRMLASLLLWPEGEGHALVASADIVPALAKKLSMYILRSKVKLVDASADTALIGLSGANAATLLGRAGLPLPEGGMQQAEANGVRVVRLQDDLYLLAVATDAAAATFGALLEAGAAKAGTAAWELATIRAGLPLVTAATQEEFVAQMLNYEVIGGVNFKKGCYPGQEIVARTQYLGKLKKRMYRVAGDAGALPAAGSDLYAPDFGDQSAGKLVNVAPSPAGGFEALAVLQSSSAEAGEIHLGNPSGPLLKLLELPYALP